MTPRPPGTSSKQKLLGANNNDNLLESVRYRPDPGHHLLVDLAAAVHPQGAARRSDRRNRRTCLRWHRGVRQPVAEMVVLAVRRHHHLRPWLPGAVPGPGQLERRTAGLLVPGQRQADRVFQRPAGLDRRARMGKGNGQGRRPLRADLRQIRRHAHRGRGQGPTGAENGRAAVRLQLLGVPRFRRQGCLRLP